MRFKYTSLTWDFIDKNWHICIAYDGVLKGATHVKVWWEVKRKTWNQVSLTVHSRYSMQTYDAIVDILEKDNGEGE